MKSGLGTGQGLIVTWSVDPFHKTVMKVEFLCSFLPPG